MCNLICNLIYVYIEELLHDINIAYRITKVVDRNWKTTPYTPLS